MTMAMTMGSLFDGSGGFPLAGAMCGMKPIWAAEVEPYPIAVTRSRFPQMRHLGSVTEIDGGKIPPVDVITGGSPCQNLSIAGGREGLHEGRQSSLFFEQIRIIKEMRKATNGEYPKFAVWENVPGAFSSNKGEDFRCVLESFAQIGGGAGVSIPRPENGKWCTAGEIVGDGYSVAWRQLDAQYWGVSQRRKRIYLVSDFAGERAGEILFEREGLRGHPASSGAPGQDAADDAARGTGGSRGVECLNPWDAQSIRQYAIDGVFPALGANSGGGQNRADVCYAADVKCMNPWDSQSYRQHEGDGVYPALQAHQGGRYEGVCYALDSMSSNSMKSSNPRSGFHEETVSKTLQAGGVDPTCNQGGNVIVEPVYALQGNGIDRAETAGCNGKGWREDVCYTLNTIDRPAICFKPRQGAKARSMGESETVSPTLGSEAGGNSIPTVCFKERAGCPGGGKGILTDKDGAAFTLSTRTDQNVCYPQIARTLTAEADASPCIDRGQNVVCYDARGNGDGEHCPTLTGDHENRVTDYTAVCVMAHGQSNAEITESISSTLNCNHEQPIAAYGVDCRNGALDAGSKPPRKYIIRRLTPLECCRLQGFPDGWGTPDHKDRLSDEELTFWQQVRDTCASIGGKPSKKYSAEALTKWYNGLHTDSAEYKMWGNGIALPCAAMVMAGIRWASEQS